MKKYRAKAVCKILDQIIMLKKGYTIWWPSYLMEKNDDGDWYVAVTFSHLNDMLQITSFLENYGQYTIEVKSNIEIRIS